VRPNCRCEDNIKIDLQDVGNECVDWATIIRYSGGSRENAIAHSGFANGKKFLEYLSDYYYLKKDFACDYEVKHRISSKAEVQNVCSP
jgi:hypothetical protein